MDPLELRGGDHRTNVGRRLEAATEPQFLGAPDELIDEPVRDGAVRDHARRGGAALPGRAECAPHDPVQRQVDIGVVEHHDRVLTAELARDALQQATADLADVRSGVGRSRERNEVDPGVRHEMIAKLAAGPEHEVQDTLG